MFYTKPNLFIYTSQSLHVHPSVFHNLILFLNFPALNLHGPVPKFWDHDMIEF